MKTAASTEKAPIAIGPYSQGAYGEKLIFVSGQLPIDPATGEMPATIEEQTAQSLANVKAVLESVGSSLAKVYKTTVFLSNINNFAAMNRVYESVFAGTVFPARSAFEVAALPKAALVEIEVIAHL